MTITTLGSPVTLPDGITVPLSRGVSANGLVLVSGQNGLDNSGRLVEGGIEKQTEQTLLNIQEVLQHANLQLTDVVKTTVWLTVKQNFAEFNRVYARFFPDRPPARSTVVSELLIPDALVEIEAIALKTGD